MSPINKQQLLRPPTKLTTTSLPPKKILKACSKALFLPVNEQKHLHGNYQQHLPEIITNIFWLRTPSFRSPAYPLESIVSSLLPCRPFGEDVILSSSNPETDEHKGSSNSILQFHNCNATIHQSLLLLQKPADR